MIPFLAIAVLILACTFGAVAHMQVKDDTRHERYIQSLRREMVRAERRAQR